MIRLLALSLTLLALHSLGAEPATLRVVVVPFAALTDHIPTGASAKARSMLVTELTSTGAFTVVEPSLDAGVPLASAALDRARAQVEKAKELRVRHRLPRAREVLAGALEAYGAAATALTDVSELVDCYALSSAVAYASGRDEDGQRALLAALALAPDRELPLAKTSALFSHVVDDARQGLKATTSGALMVSSIPSNAPVTLDGHLLGATPLEVRAVPPGPHLWTVDLSMGERVGGLVEVASGRSVEVVARPAQLDSATKLLQVVAKNQLDQTAVVAARELARATQADLVVFGALSAEGKGLALDTFLCSADGSPRRLPRRAFDPELLSARMELYGLAGELAQTHAALGAPVPLPSRRPEVHYGTSAPGPTPSEATGEPPGVPSGPRRRVPLKTR